MAEYTAFEDVAVLCAHLADVDPRFATVGRRAEDRQFQRRLALEAAGLALPAPDERTAEIAGRLYQLPEVTASVVREPVARDVSAEPISPPGRKAGGVDAAEAELCRRWGE